MEGAAQTLVSSVGQLVSEEFRQLRGVGSEVAELRDELASMNAMLRVHSEADDGAVDHFIREWMKQVRELAYDAEDCVHLYIFRIRCRRRNGVLVWSKRMFATLSSRRRLAADIKDLRARFLAVSERRARYSISRDVMCPAPPFAPVVPAVAASGHQISPDDLKFFGMKEQVHSLAEQVEHPSEPKLKVTFVVGFEGFGKTALARRVCRWLHPEFEHQAQVSVSKAFDVSTDLKELVKSIVQQIAKTTPDNEIEEDVDLKDLEQLVGVLRHLLHGNRYLIMIDDVSTTVEMDAIQSLFPDNNCGSRIIVTTRVEAVAKACIRPCTWEDEIYHMKPLMCEDSKKVFVGRVFGPGRDCPMELRDEMDSIFKKCGGQPLAIITIASLLARYNVPEGIDMWVRVRKSICSHMESNPTLAGMNQILRLCYHHLPHYLKDCVMYLTIFPEGRAIKKNRLLNGWLAEELVAEEPGLTMMETAEAYYDELISRSIIYPVANMRQGQRVEACQVHSMMLEVIVSKAVEANFVRLVGRKYAALSNDRIRRLSVHGHGDGQEAKEINVQHVRSLSMFKFDGHKLLDRLQEFTLMRVLDLEECKGVQNKHIKDICRMYLLRFLNLRGTDISLLSPKIGDLDHLRILDVADTCLDTLPRTVTKLEKLERVSFRNKHRSDTIWAPPPGVGKMKALREVDYILIKDAHVAREIGELGKLRQLGIFLPEYIENKQEVLDGLALSLSMIYSLRSLSIGCLDASKANALNFLLELESPPRLLRFLCISGGVEQLPDWVASLAYLNDIHISSACLHGDQVFGILCEVPNLENISLGPRCFVDEEVVVRRDHGFGRLRSLSICCSGEFPRVIRFEKGSMRNLETLSVQFGGTGKVEGIEHLWALKEVQLTGKKGNMAMHHALEHLKAENELKIAVTYD